MGGGVMSVVAVIIMIAGHVTAGASTDVGFELEGVTSGTITVASGEDGGLGYGMFIDQAQDANCAAINTATTVTDPNGGDVSIGNECSIPASGWQLESDPKVRPI